MSFTTHFERLELKFLIDELCAERVCSQIEPYCVPDAHCQSPAKGRRGRVGYPISSLYLDTPGLAFHRAKERGDANRIKLRIRSYSDVSPASFEIKRRHSNIIDKLRAVVPRDRVEAAARGMLPENLAPKQQSILRDFARVVGASGAAPTLAVRYEREAYESLVDGYARVTFDRAIAVQPVGDWSLRTRPSGWTRFDEHWRCGMPTTPVVLELKCETTIPFWLMDLIRSNDLGQTTFSKYSVGIELTQRQHSFGNARSRSLSALG